jgi:HSP20 family protein
MKLEWRKNRDHFGSIFDAMSHEFDQIEQVMNNVLRTAPSRTAGHYSVDGPFYYGFSITPGPDDKPVLKEFGNIRNSEQGDVANGIREPIREPIIDTIVDDKEGKLRVTCEMPGVTKQDIKLTVNEDGITISATNGDKKYNTDIPLSVKIEPDSADASYNNGILDLKLTLKESPTREGLDVKIK